MLPIFTVTYSEDFWATVLQAHSIEKFVDDPTVHYVAIEDAFTHNRGGQYTQRSIEEWKQQLEPIYQKHKLVLITQDRYPKFWLHDQISGWTRQQYIKLCIADMLRGGRSLSLDTKNVFVHTVNISDTYRLAHGAQAVIDDNYLGSYKPWIEHVETVLNTQRPKNYWMFGTPFVFKNRTVQNIARRTDLAGLFLHPSVSDIHMLASEYLLYSFFVPEQEIQPYSVKNNPVYTYYRDMLNSIDQRNQVKQKLIDAGLPAHAVIPAVNTSRRDRYPLG